MDKFKRFDNILEICKAIDEVVDKIGGGKVAKRLLLGTAAVESDFEHTTQIGGGPAVSHFMIEPDTARDTYNRFLKSTRIRQLIRAHVVSLRDSSVLAFTYEIERNIKFACALARIRYMYDPDPIPTTLEEQAGYWKRVYNTEAGAGTVDEYMEAWDIHRCEEWCEIVGWDLGYA